MSSDHEPDEPPAKEMELEDENDKNRFFSAIDNDDVNTLRKLLDSRESYLITDGDGNSLLQRAIIKDKKNVFEYILSLDDYPLENCNKKKQTALTIALTGFVDDNEEGPEIEEYYALRLLAKGVEVYELALHHAAEKDFIEVSKLLLDRGFDPNLYVPDEGTPLHAYLNNLTQDFELGALLLSYGADPLIERNSYTGFELALHNFTESRLFFEPLCLYTLDESRFISIHLSVLLKLVQKESAFFETVLQHVNEIVIDSASVFDSYLLTRINEKYLRILVEKCGFMKILVMISSNDIEGLVPFSVNTENSYESLVSCIETTLDQNVIDFVRTLDSTVLLISLCQTGLEEPDLREIICYLLSYGFEMNELDLQIIHQIYGYCELFKILLHMDFKLGVRNTYTFRRVYFPIESSIFPIFICNVALDLRTYVENVDEYSVRNVSALLDYFANPELKKLCETLGANETIKAKMKSLPEVPLLLQLARDAFRKFVVNKYGLKTSAQFYTYMNCLPINKVYKQIITFEKKLY